MQRSVVIRTIEQGLRGLDWTFIKGSTVMSIGHVVARGLGMAFSLVLARAFTPEAYGEFRYALTITLIIAIGTQPFGQHVVARFVGKYLHDPEHLQRVLVNMWAILTILFGLTLLVAVPFLLILDQFSMGIVIIFVGLTLFYLYWGLCRGYQASKLLTTAYVGSNIVQLILVFLLIYGFKIQSPLMAMVIYGSSYFLPLALLQSFWPFPIRFNMSHLRRDIMREIIRFSQPIWISHASYILYNSIVILMLERFLGTEAVGVFALARTTSIVFQFVPSGMATFLMPRVAGLSKSAARHLFKQMLALALLVNGVGLFMYLLLIDWFVRTMIGSEYIIGIEIYALLALGEITSGTHSMITALLVGSDKAGLEAVGRGVALSGTALIGWLLIPIYGPLGAAIATLSGSLSALMTYGLITSIKKMKNTQKVVG